MVELVILSIVQGITEFLPISSSAHLILISKYFNFNNSNLTLDVSLHLGSLLAIIFHFINYFLNFIANKKLFFKILLTSIPITILGYFLVKFNYIDLIRNYKIIGWSTIIFGIALLLSDNSKTNKNIFKNFNYKNIFFIGVFQVLALIPGVSRSGIIITISRTLGFNRIDSANISLLTSIPVLIFVSIYNLKKIILQNNLEISIINFSSVILSFFFSYITIKFFLNFLKKFNLTVFAFYRVFLGIIILIYVYR